MSAAMAKASGACSITLVGHIEYTRPGQKWPFAKERKLAEIALHTLAACDRSQLAAISSIAESFRVSPVTDIQ